ncbi:MAG: hypothetical protein KDJ37_15020 [Hyphomicrobiaceae bacterium]|nr:hypothetical protein [Hyphomicrobiaceae bacterium]
MLLRTCVPRWFPAWGPGVTVAVIVSMAIGGCSSRSAERAEPDVRVAAPYAGPAARSASVEPPSEEMEADGLPAQRPPLLRPRRGQDDPSEPFSPNYGRVAEGSGTSSWVARASYSEPVGGSAGASTARLRDDRYAPDDNYIPDDLPPDVRRRLVSSARAE